MTIYGRSEELVSRCIECDLAEPESLASLGGSAPGLVDGILSHMCDDVMHASHSMHMQASLPPYIYMAHQELLMDVPFAQAKQYLSKITASHFSTLNTGFANWNVLKRILIAMLNENKADWNENFRICAG